MCSLRWSALWPRAIAVTLIGLGAASCSDSDRFSDFFGPDPYARNQVTGSVQQRAPAPAMTGHIDSQPLPPVASAETQGMSGGGRGMASYQQPNAGGYQSGNSSAYPQTKVGGAGGAGSYQPYQPPKVAGGAGTYQPPNAGGYQSGNTGSYRQANAGGYQSGNTNSYPQGGASSYQPGHMGAYQPASNDITGTARPMTPPPVEWTWEGGTPVIVAPGETIEAIARKHNVPVAAIMQANSISSPVVHPGQHLVIPRYRTPSLAYAPPTTRITTTMPAVPSPAPVARPRPMVPTNAAVHVVVPGETLHSIARQYGKSDMAVARANDMRPNAPMHVGERIIIPDAREREQLRVEVLPERVRRDVANVESPTSAWTAKAVEQPSEKQSRPAEQTPAKETTPPIKAAEPAGSLPSFRWPARGQVIAGFGAQPGGLQNDGIDVAIPNGTPVRAADDGVVTYAGDELKGYGNLVLIRHSTGYVTAYAHANEILVKHGDTVKRGQVIARSGATGTVKEPELHFEIRKGATPVDPSTFLGN
jgi:murein DD-endopeptidase MepM/ murein hydrolase activator NlpD